MHRLLCVLLLAAASFASAATRPAVRTFAPTSIVVASGEQYMTIEGSNFISGTQGPVVRFSGPAGDFEVAPSVISGSEYQARMQVWVPVAVVHAIGRHTMVVHHDVHGDSVPFSLYVNGDSRILITVPSWVVVPATGPSGAVVTYEASAESTAGAPVDFSCTPASGSTFPLGYTVVVCTGRMDDGASRIAQFPVSVVDRTPPQLTVPADILVEAASSDGTVVHYQVSAMDVVDTDVAVNCVPASGTLFPIRTTEVRCNAVDDSRNSAYGNFAVTVVDNASPMLMLPGDMTVPATTIDGAVVTYDVTAMDSAERTIPAVCTPESGSLFHIGTTDVRCTAQDDMGRRTSGAFRVTVTPSPQPAPALVLPADFTVPATSAEGAVVTFAVSATDYAQRTIPVTCTPASGSLFGIGMNTVICTAVDDRNISTTRNFYIRVVAADLPQLFLPAGVTVEALTPGGTEVTFAATARDAADGDLPVSCTPASGSTFALGTTEVTCSATNSRGGTAMGTFEVHVVDTRPPAILSITATPDRLWPLNKRLVDVTVGVTASDDADTAPRARVVSVMVSEGVKESDWRIVGELTVALRADRNGKEKPRVYTIHVEVSDASGNVSAGTVSVIVPHDNPDNTNPQPQRRRRSAGS